MDLIKIRNLSYSIIYFLTKPIYKILLFNAIIPALLLYIAIIETDKRFENFINTHQFLTGCIIAFLGLWVTVKIHRDTSEKEYLKKYPKLRVEFSQWYYKESKNSEYLYQNIKITNIGYEIRYLKGIQVHLKTLKGGKPVLWEYYDPVNNSQNPFSGGITLRPGEFKDMIWIYKGVLLSFGTDWIGILNNKDEIIEYIPHQDYQKFYYIKKEKLDKF